MIYNNAPTSAWKELLFEMFEFAPVGQLTTVRRGQGFTGTSGRLQSGKVELLLWVIFGDSKTNEAVSRSRCHFKKVV
jgi:hypothetical protein